MMKTPLQGWLPPKTSLPPNARRRGFRQKAANIPCNFREALPRRK